MDVEPEVTQPNTSTDWSQSTYAPSNPPCTAWDQTYTMYNEKAEHWAHEGRVPIPVVRGVSRLIRRSANIYISRRQLWVLTHWGWWLVQGTNDVLIVSLRVQISENTAGWEERPNKVQGAMYITLSAVKYLFTLRYLQFVFSLEIYVRRQREHVPNALSLLSRACELLKLKKCFFWRTLKSILVTSYRLLDLVYQQKQPTQIADNSITWTYLNSSGLDVFNVFKKFVTKLASIAPLLNRKLEMWQPIQFVRMNEIEMYTLETLPRSRLKCTQVGNTTKFISLNPDTGTSKKKKYVKRLISMPVRWKWGVCICTSSFSYQQSWWDLVKFIEECLACKMQKAKRLSRFGIDSPKGDTTSGMAMMYNANKWQSTLVDTYHGGCERKAGGMASMNIMSYVRSFSLGSQQTLDCIRAMSLASNWNAGTSYWRWCTRTDGNWDSSQGIEAAGRFENLA